MTIRVKAEIFKPKTYLNAIQDLKPVNVKAVLADPKWNLAMTK